MPSSPSLSLLPPAVIDMIFHFAVAPNKKYLPTSAECEVVIPKSFSAIALTSKEWFKLVAELRSDEVLSSVEVTQTCTRSQLIRQRNALLRRRGFVSRLRAKVFNFIPDYDGYGVDAEWQQPDAITEDILACVPHLRELDLQRLRLSKQQLTQIAVTAATLCPLIHTLLFPSPLTKSSQPNHTVVLTSARGWLSSRVMAKGLRHLRLYMVHSLVDVQSSNAYVNLVITSCPNIEILDDGKYPNNARRRVVSFHEDSADADLGTHAARWRIDLATWTRFCETCTRLTKFNWLGVPFATRFFEAFGDSSKPQLKELTLGAARGWNWERYNSQVNAEIAEALYSGGYGGDATNVQALFRACPQLRALRIKSALYASVFDEDFWVALTQSCPLLESLVVCRHSAERMRFTDGAAHALASLSSLCFARLDNVRLSGDALVALVVLHSADTRQKRNFRFNLSNQDNEYLFYVVLEQFLTRLASYDGVELPCGSRPVRLELASFDSSEDKPWSAQYFARVRGIAQQAHVRYPTVMLKGVVTDFDEEDAGFGCIKTFTFATEPAHAYEGDSTDDGEYERIDNVFVCNAPSQEELGYYNYND